MEKSLDFEYSMSLDFSQPVNSHKFTLRMIPHSDERQQITDCQISISPDIDLQYDADAFGNRYVFGEIKQPHNRFSVRVTGKALINPEIYVPDNKSKIMLAPFRFPTHYTRASQLLKDYYDIYKPQPNESDFDFCERLMHQIYKDMVYMPGVTDINTTAADAFEHRRGVCQDYAHIMLSLCRIADIPCRYTVGMMQGEGFSHAWVEIMSNVKWYGMDPTNDKLVDDTYIKISHGRDYKDCIVNRGVFTGFNAMQTQTIYVKVI